MATKPLPPAVYSPTRSTGEKQRNDMKKTVNHFPTPAPVVTPEPKQEPHIPSFAKDLLRETTDPPPPKSETRKWIEAIANDLKIPLQVETYVGYKAVMSDRKDDDLLGKIRDHVTDLKNAGQRDARVIDAVDTLAERFARMMFFGPMGPYGRY
jgi:hypothetical protein